jgi:hypothetical protein
MSLSNKAMLIKVSFSQWTARKFDKNATAVVANAYTTDENAGRYNKLLVEEKAIKPINQIVNAARAYFREHTLPWQDDHYRILPAAEYQEFTQEIRNYRVQFENAVLDFANKYPDYINDARAKLNGMFDPQDYPQNIETLYQMNVDVIPMPEKEDFRVVLAEEDVGKIRDDIERKSKAAVEGAMTDLWKRLHTAVYKMTERLSCEDNTFKDTLVSNLTDLCELLPKLNIMDDPQLAFMCQQVEQKLCCYSPKELRKDMIQRKQAATDAEEILKNMPVYGGGNNGSLDS